MIYTSILPTFEQISLISTTNINSDYDVLQMLDANENPILTFVKNNTITIDNVVYTTSSGAIDLEFDAIVTSEGTKFIFQINEQTSNIKLPDGVFKLKLFSATNEFTTLVFLYKTIQCCLAKKVSKVGCNTTNEDIINIAAVIETTKAATASNLQNEANCGYKILTTYCENCGCK